MSPKQVSILADVHPRRHIVYPYNDEEKAVHAVFLFASSGLSKGESVVLMMADHHQEPVTGRLAGAGFDLPALQESGRLECISADSMLRGLMGSGALDEDWFIDQAREIIGRAKASAPGGNVRIFGEMVSLLLARNDVAMAHRLEQLWNQVIEAHSVSLFCTYALTGTEFKTLPDSLALMHSHTLPAISEL